MAQFLRPNSTISGGSWTGDHTAIDEITASDADLAYSQNNPNGSNFEVGLSTGDTPLGLGHTVRLRAAKVNNGVLSASGSAVDLAVHLKQGATTIRTYSISGLTGAWVAHSFSLTQGEADLITNYAALSVSFVATGGAGAQANRRGGAVSWNELEIPNAEVYVPDLTGSFFGAVS